MQQLLGSIIIITVYFHYFIAMYVTYPACQTQLTSFASIFAVGVGYWCVLISKRRSNRYSPHTGTCKLNSFIVDLF